MCEQTNCLLAFFKIRLHWSEFASVSVFEFLCTARDKVNALNRSLEMH